MDNEFSFTALFILGLFSSFHCIGMCGGVIGALTFSLDRSVQEDKKRLFVYVGAYNLGRILSYMIAGFIVGMIGMTLVGLIGMEKAHTITRYLSAFLIILVGLYLAGWFPQFVGLDKLGASLWKRIQPLGQRFMPVKKPWQALGFGMVWGWIPCGLVYTALLLAVLGGGAIDGALGMLAFGFGTLPAVMGAGIATGGLSQWLQKPFIRQLFGVIMLILGIMFLLKPMNHSAHIRHAPPGQMSGEMDHEQRMQKGMKCG